MEATEIASLFCCSLSRCPSRASWQHGQCTVTLLLSAAVPHQRSKHIVSPVCQRRPVLRAGLAVVCGEAPWFSYK